MKEIVQKVKGTRDFYPEDMILHYWLGEQTKRGSSKNAKRDIFNSGGVFRKQYVRK